MGGVIEGIYRNIYLKHIIDFSRVLGKTVGDDE